MTPPTLLAPSTLEPLWRVYREGLLQDTLPFWIPRAIDREHGGYLTSFDEDGTLLHPDKPVWFQGRFAWLLSTLYRTVERRPEWLEWARHGLDFIDRHCFDVDGRMFFSTTREGKPLRKRRYLYSEVFATMAMAAYARASGDGQYAERALALFKLILRYHRTPGLLPPKTDPATRPQKGLSMPMCLIVAAQELRPAVDDPLLTATIDETIAEIERDFLKPELRCVLETVGPEGQFLDTFEGRMLCPGHALEVGWFILEEARLRQRDARLLRLGRTVVDWSFAAGWDGEHGGLLYYRDAKGLPCTEYWHDMKFWWPHNEAIIACLLAWELTGDPRYARWHGAVHDWAYGHFPDPVHGEWFGYLHRDGTVATRLKGNLWKGPFHLPRMQWYCGERLAAMLRARTDGASTGWGQQ